MTTDIEDTARRVLRVESEQDAAYGTMDREVTSLSQESYEMARQSFKAARQEYDRVAILCALDLAREVLRLRGLIPDTIAALKAAKHYADVVGDGSSYLAFHRRMDTSIAALAASEPDDECEDGETLDGAEGLE